MTVIPSILLSATMLMPNGADKIIEKLKECNNFSQIQNVCEIKDILSELGIDTNDKFFDFCEKNDIIPSPDEDKPQVTPVPTVAPQPTAAPEIVPQPTAAPEVKPTETPENNNSSFTYQVVELVNKERRARGLSDLKVNETLMNAAHKRAVETKTSFSHTRPNGQSFSTVLAEFGINYRSAGENIAYGQTSPEAVVNAWMNSSGHRANILNSSYTEIGVGCYKSGNTYYWAQLFIS